MKSKPKKDERRKKITGHIINKLPKKNKTVKTGNNLNRNRRKRTQYKERNKDKKDKRFYVRSYVSNSRILII